MRCLGLERLRIAGLRNIEESELLLDGRCALLTGCNGAGKTTVLEAVYLLARGRSFRGRRAGDLTTAGLPETRVQGRIVNGGEASDWLFQRTGRVSGRWVDGVSAAELSEIASRLSVKLIGENAQQLLDGEPGLRRRFLDWTLFHVEPGYSAAWKRYRHTLEQRNAWLRQGARGRAVWDEGLVSAGDCLESLRQSGVLRIGARFRSLAEPFAGLSGAELVYSSGVPTGCRFADALVADRETERVLGYTRVGPHRADFGIGRKGKRLALSRGQQKGIVCLLQLACGDVQEALSETSCIWLLDDLWSELDGATADALLAVLLDGGRQCLFTMIGGGQGSRPSALPADTRMFHVEHGRVLAR